jgi:hypothetical protein
MGNHYYGVGARKTICRRKLKSFFDLRLLIAKKQSVEQATAIGLILNKI